MTYDIFISHAVKDADGLMAVYNYFEARGFSCFTCEHCIDAGEDYPTIIAGALKSSSVFLLLHSENVNQSEQVLREVVMAGNSHLPIFSLKLDTSSYNDALEFQLCTSQWVDGSKNLREACFQIEKSICIALKRPVPKKVLSEKEQQDDFRTKVGDLYMGAVNGDNECRYQLGAALRNRRYGLIRNLKLSEYWLKMAAENRHVEAAAELGMMYAELNKSEACQWLQFAAMNGHSMAQIKLGNIYRVGRIVARNYVKAFQWFRMAAEDGNETAQNELGRFYIKGWGVEKDYNQGYQWLLRAAEKNINAKINLAVCYLNGYSVKSNEAKGIEMLNNLLADDLLETEHKATIYRAIGHYYWNSERFTDAVPWFEKALEAGVVSAAYYLFMYYEEGKGGKTDPQKALEYLKDEYRKANADLAAKYAKLLWNKDPRLVPDGELSAADLYNAFKKAGDLGSLWGKTKQAQRLQRGLGIKEDQQEAFALFKFAAQSGYAEAQRELALCYMVGTGTPVDEQKAFEWTKKAAEAGSIKAMGELGKFYLYGVGADQDFQQAFTWLDKACQQEEVPKQVYLDLAYCYEHGVGVKQNMQKAFELRNIK